MGHRSYGQLQGLKVKGHGRSQEAKVRFREALRLSRFSNFSHRFKIFEYLLVLLRTCCECVVLMLSGFRANNCTTSRG